jgi:hypothetical protein
MLNGPLSKSHLKPVTFTLKNPGHLKKVFGYQPLSYRSQRSAFFTKLKLPQMT